MEYPGLNDAAFLKDMDSLLMKKLNALLQSPQKLLLNLGEAEVKRIAVAFKVIEENSDGKNLVFIEISYK